MYSTTDHLERLSHLLNRASADLIEQRNDSEAFTRLQLEAQEALSVHLGRSSIPSNQE
jgi:hypothetical protein